MKKNQSKELVQLLDLVGGKENIEKLSHCISRLRFNLVDITKANEIEINKLSFVKGIKQNSGQFQVIIGTEVEQYYQEFKKVNNIDSGDAPNQNTNQVNDLTLTSKPRRSFISFVSEIFNPILPMLVAYGLFELIKLPFFLTSNLAFKDGTNFVTEFTDILDTISKGMVFFISIGISYSVFKAMGSSLILGIMIGCIVCSPALMSMGEAAALSGDPNSEFYEKQLLEIIPGWHLFGSFTFPWKISFEGLVIPIIFVALAGVGIDKGLNKVNFGGARLFIQPVLIIFLTSLLTFLIIAPIGLLMTNYMSIGIKWLISNDIAKYFFTPLIAALYSPMVIFGLHRTITPLLMQDIALYNGSVLLGVLIISNIATSVACITFAIRVKNVAKLNNMSKANGISGLVAGVTEPALYSVNLKYIYPMVSASAASLVGGLIITAAGVWTGAAPFSILGVIGFLGETPKGISLNTWPGGGAVWGILAIVVTIALSIVFTIILGNVKYFKDKFIKIVQEEYGINDLAKHNEIANDLRARIKNEIKEIKSKDISKDEKKSQILELKSDYENNLKTIGV